ncbi:MAG: penicillin-binding protein 2 [Coriobacteriia bacterium]|nr:penicillin-binding protein 2 [Coriobacteriia bacterium]
MKKDASWTLARVLTVFFGALLLITATRLIWIQAIRGKALRQEAEDARVMPHSTPAQRGGIFDRDGIPLALSSTVYDVIADPVNLNQKGRAAQMLADVLEGSVDFYYAELIAPTHYAVMARGISQNQRDMLIDYIDDLPSTTDSEIEFKIQMQNCIVFELNYQRYYPAGTAAAQTLGWVRTDTGDGQAGIELYYDGVLKGKPGSSTSERDVFGNLIPSGVQKEVPAQAGQPLILTIDYHIQSFADNELAAAAEACEAKAGALIVMEVKTGELLAVCSYPAFDLNEYGKAREEEFRNRALLELYEPGSTLKPITAAAALETGVVTTATEFEVPSAITVGIHEVSDDSPHDVWPQANLAWILQNSSNVGTSKVAFTIGCEALYKQYQQVGFTTVSESDFPALTPAVIAKPDQWLDIELSNHSFGQGLAVSPLMMTRALAAIGNGGLLVTPHLLKETPGDAGLKRDWPVAQVITPKVAGDVTAIMENVMINGTGSGIHLDGFRVAGKTGTAQKAAFGQGYDTDAYVGSFIGFFPVEDPQIIVFVMLDEPAGNYYGAYVAGPPFVSVASFTAEHLGIEPTILPESE